MGIQRATVLYPVNSTTVDTGAGVDVRLLDSAQAGATDTSQTAQATHTQDNAERTFDPATANTAITTSAYNVLAKAGWALRLTQDMTPADDTNCDCALGAGTLTVNISVAINQAGGTYVSGTYAPSWNVSLWRYNPSTDSATLIGSSTNNGTSWNVNGGDIGTFKTVSQTISVASLVAFAQGEVLYLQIGVNTGVIPNPTIGTATWTYTLAVDDPNTNITFASGQGIQQSCSLSGSAVGRGFATRGSNQIAMGRSAVGIGVPTSAKATIASKTLSLVGIGVITSTRPLQASRAFNLVGIGAILTTGSNASTITLPIDEIPAASATTVRRPVYVFGG